MLNKLKSLNPNDVAKLEGKILDADNLDGICENCLFDIELTNGQKLELKSFSKNTIKNLSSNSKFINQFKAYLAGAKDMDDFEYIFNGNKSTDLELIEKSFQEIFKNSNYGIWDDMEKVGSNIFRTLGITNKSEFALKVSEFDQELFKFIRILI